MSKKLNIDRVASELGQSAFFRPTETPHEEQPEEMQTPVEPRKRQSTSRSISQSTKQSTRRPSNQQDNKIVDRPKAFYITERLDKRLDEAVRYLQDEHGIKKVDRSTLINALLDNEATFSDAALDNVVDRVLTQLTNRLVR